MIKLEKYVSKKETHSKDCPPVVEYLSTKIKNKISYFPKEIKSKEKVICFLEMNGFSECIVDINDINKITNGFESTNDKQYICADVRNGYWLRFFKGGKITEKNPVFTIQYIEPGYSGHGEYYYIETKKVSGITKMSRADFMELLAEHFEWL